MVGLAETTAVLAPLALVIAVVMGRRRERRRRAALNRALHELRRPLQFLALMRSAPARMRGRGREGAWGQLDAALAALADLDAEINGRGSSATPRPVRADELVAEAVERWRSPAAFLGRELELRWSAGRTAVLGDAAALSRALDNLVANSLEHGAKGVRLEGTTESGRLKIAVIDGLGASGGVATLAGPLAPGPSRNGDPRRGHGLAVCARIASSHGGRLLLARQGTGARAVLELPLALGSARARSPGQPSLAV